MCCKMESHSTLLGIPSEALDITENDNVCKAEPCCNAMLKKWLQVDTTASWEKLFTAIESPAVPSSEFVTIIIIYV